MTTSTTDAEAIARIIEAEIEHDIKGNIAWANGKRAANAILSYLASRREAQEPVAFADAATLADFENHRGHAYPRHGVVAADAIGQKKIALYTAPPAPAGEIIEEFRQALGDARDEASDSLRTLDAIAEFVGCPHDEELTVDHVRQHYTKLENAAQRQGILDAGRIANAEARAAGEVERLRKALAFYANPEIYKPHPHGPAFDRRDLSGIARAALNGGRE